MILLKEDGSLDIERIKALPLKEYICQISHLTKEQHKEYVSKIPINESKKPLPIIYGSLKEDLESGEYFDMRGLINNL